MVGPSIIFDKSALQSLSVDESVWLDRFFLGNITPLFYVETLADLEKKVREGQTAESAVGLIAAKSPPGAVPNAHHQTMILQELAGAPHLLMDTRPVLAGGMAKRTPDGKVAIDFDVFAEAEALNRWREGEFLEVERKMARSWRAALASHDVDREVAIAANLLPTGTRISDLAQLKGLIDQLCLSTDRHLLDLMMEQLDIPRLAHPKIRQRWVDAGSPSDLSVLAPFSTHVFKVNLLYLLGVARGFISGERASNRADMAYLYYLPFCMVFTSGDGLHRRTVPLFLNDRQRFIPAEDLKVALAELDAHYGTLPDSVKGMGAMRFSSYPPSTLDNEVTRSWDHLMRPDWREIATKFEAEMLDPSYPDRPLGSAAGINAMHDASTPMTGAGAEGLGLDDADVVFVKKSMPIRRGKWTMLPTSITGEEPTQADS